MSLFVEVNDVEKGCPVIINLDTVMEIAPLKSGGCEISFPDSAAVGGKRAMKVTDTYDQFKQFAMQTVSSEDIKNRIEKLTAAAKSAKLTKTTLDIPTL
jgi:hypothetical protein